MYEQKALVREWIAELLSTRVMLLQLRKLYSFFSRYPLYVVSLLFLAALPFFAGKIIVSEHAYIFGRYINYLHVRIALQPILGLVVLIFWYIQNEYKQSKLGLFLLAIGIFSLLSIYATYMFGIATDHNFWIYSFASIFHILTTAVTIIGGIIAIKTVIEFPKEKILQIALTTVGIVQLLLGTLQVFFASPILPMLFTKLGQPPEFTSFTYIGTAIFSRTYGTTPHPNILAGVLVLFIFFLLATAKTKKVYVLLIPLILGILLTFSRGALFAAIGLLGLFAFRNRLINIKLPLFITFLCIQIAVLCALPIFNQIFPTESFIASRTQIEMLYLALAQNTPTFLLTGTGFTMSIPELFRGLQDLPITAVYRNQLLAEPPHNILLLLGIEAGIPTALFLLYSFFRFAENEFQKTPAWQKYSLLLILSVLGGVDHFLIY